MATQERGKRWIEVVVALDAIVAALMLVTAVYLLDPAAIDLGFYIETGRHALTGWFLLYASVVLALAAVFGSQRHPPGILSLIYNVVLGSTALLGLGLIHIALAVEGVLFTDPMRPWLAVLFAPGLLSLVSSFVAQAAQQASVVEAPTTAESGKQDPGTIWRTHLQMGVLSAIVNAIFVFYIGVGFFSYYLLRASLIDDVEFDLDALIARSIPDLWQALWPYALAVAAALVLIMPIIGAFSAVSRRLARVRRPTIDRDLSTEELSFIASCMAQLKSYAEEHGLQRVADRMVQVYLLFFFAYLGAFVWLVIEVEGLTEAAYAPQSAAWHLYLVNRPFAIFAVLLLAFPLAFVPDALMSFASRRYAEARGFIGSKSQSGVSALEQLIVKLVRQGTLSPSSSFSAPEFLRARAYAPTAIALTSTVVAVAIIAVVWPHDRAMDTLYTDAGIETGDFWTMERTTYPYAAVHSVNVGCDLDKSGDPHISYELLLPGERRRSLVIQRDLEARLNDLARVDEYLRAAGVAFSLGAQPGSIEAVDPECVMELAEDADPARRAKLEALFHLDAWYERRWRERTGRAVPQVFN